jgi:predicted site-specific integrase-resolvase
MTDQLQNELAKCRAGQAARLCGVSTQTLHNWRRAGRIKAEQDASGRYLFDVRPLMERESGEGRAVGA